MITRDSLKQILKCLDFKEYKRGQIYKKSFENSQLSVDFINEKLIYSPCKSNPKSNERGITIHDKTTCNFSKPENFVVFECVHRLLEKGYDINHIELEPKWQLGREAKSGKADILVKDKENKPYLLIECKTTDSKNSEFSKEFKRMQQDGGQLFSYLQQDSNVKFLCLYTSDLGNEELKYENIIIAVQDNLDYLRESGQEGYEKAKNVEEKFKVWSEIYKQEYSTIGIFEKQVNPYKVGENALCFDDLKGFEDKDDSKYHEFATILRKHNISGKENAFDKLVNLFLCKIYDETYNKNKLEFGYRGVSADSFENLQDRLMKLYKEAMEKFLNEKITYVGSEEIEKNFEDFSKNEISVKSLKTEIQKRIKELKFYSNNDFAFLEVHNKDLFYKNALVLVAVVRLFEKIKLTSNKTQQFLGNLFELFLQKGMKQDEGQFFTPLQICEFIIYSLPLEKAKLTKKPLRVIDYACGAGHFLNTYASFLKEHLKIDEDILEEHYKHIYGIEKEYRLSKVAKVSASMYGQQHINILYFDALDCVHLEKNLSNFSFDLLIANPPYSVKGFLGTLSGDSKSKYELYAQNKLNEESDTIECFFVERAIQLLSDNAKAAIILPRTFLSNLGIDKTARELLLKNFRIVSIVELGSNTFGATGTNTIILFLTKLPSYDSAKSSNAPLLSQKFANLQDRLDNLLKDDKRYENNDYISSYLSFRNLDENTLEKLLGTEEEKQKLLFYAMLKDDEVLIIKSPQDNKAQKAFLGYEWSNRKGYEGLRELQTPYTTPLYDIGQILIIHTSLIFSSSTPLINNVLR